jgi:hypothetical protein
MDLSESDEGWTSPVAGFEVIEVRFSGRVYVTAYGKRAEGEKEAPNTDIAVGGASTFVDRSGTKHSLSAVEPWESLVPLLSLRHDRIASAVADRTGWLTVRFDSGARLEVGPDGHYENWELVGPDGILIVGLPSGGEPAVWRAAGK